MGCFNLSCKRIGQFLVGAFRDTGIRLLCERAGAIWLGASRFGVVGIGCERTGAMSISSGLVCVVDLKGRHIYLKTSDDVFFLTSDGFKIRLVDNEI